MRGGSNTHMTWWLSVLIELVSMAMSSIAVVMVVILASVFVMTLWIVLIEASIMSMLLITMSTLELIVSGSMVLVGTIAVRNRRAQCNNGSHHEEQDALWSDKIVQYNKFIASPWEIIYNTHQILCHFNKIYSIFYNLWLPKILFDNWFRMPACYVLLYLHI